MSDKYAIDQTQPDDRTRSEKSLDLIADRLYDVLLELRVGNMHDLIAEVRDALARLDGTTRTAVQEMTGLTSDEVDDLGGLPEDVTEEPPVGSMLTDRFGSVWRLRKDGRWEVGEWFDRLPWGKLRMRAPLRLTTDADRERVGLPVTADLQIANEEVQTANDGSPRCKDEDPDEALAEVLKAHHEDRRDWVYTARAAREHIYAEPDQSWVTRDIEEAEEHYRVERERAEKAEAELAQVRESAGGWWDLYNDALNDQARLTRERDKAVKRYEALRDHLNGIKALHSEPSCDEYDDSDPVSCGWKYAYGSVLVALALDDERAKGEQR